MVEKRGLSRRSRTIFWERSRSWDDVYDPQSAPKPCKFSGSKHLEREPPELRRFLVMELKPMVSITRSFSWGQNRFPS